MYIRYDDYVMHLCIYIYIMYEYIYIWIFKLVNYDGSPAKIQKNTGPFLDTVLSACRDWVSLVPAIIATICRNLLEDGQKNILVPIRKKKHAGKQAWQWNN